MVETISDFLQRQANEQQQSTVGAANIVLGSVEQKPDDLAGDLLLAKEYNKTTGNPVPPAPMVSEYRNVFQEEIRRQRDASLLSGSVNLSKWLLNPENATLAKDDLQALSFWDGIPGAFERFGLKLPQAYNQWMAAGAAERGADQARSFGEIYGDERSRLMFDFGPLGNSRLIDTAIGPITDAVGAGSRFLTSRLAGLVSGDQQQSAQYYQQQAGIIGKQIASIPIVGAGSRYQEEYAKFKPSGDITADLGNFFSGIAKDPEGFASFAAQVVAESLPTMATALGVTAVTRSPAAGAAVSGGLSYTAEAGSATVDFFKEKGLDISTPEGAAQAIQTPGLMREAVDKGFARGLPIALMDGLSLGMAGQALAKNPLANVMLQSVMQAAFGSAGEAAGQVASGQQLNIADIALEGLLEFSTAPIEVGGVGLTKFRENRAKAQDAEARVSLFKELSGQSVNSALRNRMPDRFRDFVERATENGPVENLFIPAQDFISYFQGIGEDPYKIVDMLEGVTREDLELAKAGDVDLQIPTATYAAKLAGSEHDAFFMENMKFDPQEMTARQARDFNEIKEDALQEAFDQAEQERLEAEQWRSYEEDIYDTIVSRARQAGRSTDEATAAAALYVANYRTAAADDDMTLEEYMRAYPLPEIAGAIPEGMKLKDVDSFTRTLAEARRRKSAPVRKSSILEFISDYGGVNDPGGDIRSILDGKEIKRGRGKKTLRIVREADSAQGSMLGRDDAGKRFGVDDIAQAAIEAGLMADDPIVQEYQNAMREGREVPDITRALLNAIENEARGGVTTSTMDDPDAIAREEFFDKLEAELDRIGVSLDDDDAAIRAAYERDEAERGQMYGQVSPDQARSIDMAVEMPSDPLFAEAVANTKGASITDDGLLIDLVRYQKEEQEGATSVRTGVFYLPVGSPNAKYYKGKGSLGGAYGGAVEARGETILKRPLFVKGATGGKAPEAAWDALKGKGAMKKLDKEIFSAINQKHIFKNDPGVWYELISHVLNENGADGTMADEIIENSRQGNQLRYALQENIIAHAVRDAGYDSVVGYSKGKVGASISEVFDVREIDYPTPGETATLHPNIPLRDPRILYQDQGGARGSIEIPRAGIFENSALIRAFQSANLSTVLHETGHLFLTQLMDRAERGSVAAQERMGVIKDWWRSNAAEVAKDANRAMPDAKITSDDVNAWLDNGTTGDVIKDGAIQIGTQEQTARGFEAYLMEGKAPTVELRGTFEKFRAWLIGIYKRINGLGVNVSPEMKRVFDRMLATDEEIDKAKSDMSDSGPVFATAEEMGLTPDEYASFLKLREKGEGEAKSRLLREIMAPLRREQEKWFKDERASVRSRVEREINAMKMYRAFEWMGNRRWLGEGQPSDMPDMRLSKSVLVDRYGEGILTTLPRGKYTIYSVDGGLDPDDAAGWFGFNSGDEMIQALEKTPPRREAIEAETDKEMRLLHGDALNDGFIEREALDALHNDRRGQWMAAELKAVAEVAGTERTLTAKEARAIARQTIARMKVRDAMKAERFLAAERKAAADAARFSGILARDGVWMNNARRRIATKARAAMRGEGTAEAVVGQVEQANSSTGNYNETVAKLLDAKRRQLLNHSLYMESRIVAGEVEAAENYVAKLNKKTTREAIGGAGRRDNAQIDYLAAIDEVLDQYDFRRTSGRADERRGSLAAYIEAMKAAGRESELAIPETLLSDVSRRPYKTLPVEELRGVIDGLKNLEHTARRWDKLIDREKQRELDATVEGVVSSFEENLKRRPPGRVNSTSERLRVAGRQFLDLVLNASTILREIDGFKDFGATYQAIKAPIDEAMNRLTERRKQAAVDLEKLYDVYSKKERKRMAVREFIPALGMSLSKWERIAVALNTGNQGNYDRLVNPNAPQPFNAQQVAAIVSTLDARDADFVQSVWDYIGSFREDIAARERRKTGVEPKWVEARPVDIGGKTLKGGYYPLKYDPRLSSVTDAFQQLEEVQSIQSGMFAKAQTRNGHLKSRAGNSQQAIELDMSVLHRHVNQVVYDLELSEAVSNSWRVLQDRRVDAMFKDYGKTADKQALETWLLDVGTGEMRSGDLIGRGARTLKSNFTAAKLAFNLSTVIIQPTGLAQTMVIVGKRDFMAGVVSALNPTAVRDVALKSSFMADRETTFNKDIYDFYNDPKLGPVASTWGDIKQNIIGPVSFWLMTKVQYYVVDVPTWYAGYHQGLRKFGNDEAKAISYADDIVKRAQASGLFADRSAIERGSLTRNSRQNDVVRLFTTLGSYMFAKFNVAYERSAVAGRVIRDEGVSARSFREALSWTIDMAFLFTLEAVIMAAIKGRLPDEEDDEDDTWGKFLAKETAASVLGTIPFVRDVASTAGGFEGGGAYGAITKEFAAPFVQASQGEVDKAFVRSIINATGLASGLPATQINRIVDAGWRQAEGEDVSPAEYLLGKSKK